MVKMTSDVAAAAEVSQSVLPARCACRKHRTRTAVHKLGAVNEGQHDAKVQICDRLAVPVPLLLYTFGPSAFGLAPSWGLMVRCLLAAYPPQCIV